MSIEALIIQRPLPEATVRLLSAIDGFSKEHGVRYFLIGATARDILLHHVHNFPIRRATLDVDFGVVVADWTHFEEMAAALSGKPGFRHHPRIPHRFYFSRDEQEDLCVDLVPFGGVEDDSQQVGWPPDMTTIMNVAGYADALDRAVYLRLSNDLLVPICSIPGLVVTKLIAWLDRGDRDTKDAGDFAYVLLHYAHAGNQDRLYSEEFSVLEHVDYDLELAGAVLLGKDVLSIVSDASQIRLREVLSGNNREKLLNHMLSSVTHDDRPRLGDTSTYSNKVWRLDNRSSGTLSGSQ